MFNSAIYKRSRNAYTLECAFEYFISLIVADSFLARLLKSLNFSDSSIGIISSLISLSFIFQIVSLPILRKISRFKTFSVVIHSIGQLSFMMLYLIPFIIPGKTFKKLTAILLILIAYFGNYCVNSLIYRWGNSFVNPGKRGSFGAKKEMISLLSGVAVQFFSGYAVDYFSERNNLNGAFIFCAVSGLIYCCCDLICLLLIEQRDAELKYKREESFSDAVRYALSNKAFKASVVLSSMYSAAIYCVVGFVGTYKISDLSFSMTAVQTVNVISCLSRFAFSIPFGKYADRTSFVKAAELGLSVMAVSSLCLAFTGPGSRYLIVAYCILYNISLAGTNANLLNVTYLVVEERYFTDSLAIKNAVSGLTGFITSVISGKLLSTFQLKERYFAGINIKGQQLLALFSLTLAAAAVIFSRKMLSRYINDSYRQSKIAE